MDKQNTAAGSALLSGGGTLGAVSAGIGAIGAAGGSSAVAGTLTLAGGLATAGTMAATSSSELTDNGILKTINNVVAGTGIVTGLVANGASSVIGNMNVASTKPSKEDLQPPVKNPENSKNSADYQRLKEDLKNEQIKSTNNEIKARNTYSTANESKGRTTIATTRAESDAMNKALNNPSSGEVLDTVVMSDSRGGYYAKDGWVKMQITVSDYGGKGSVHYIYNTKTGEATDFKFADTK